MADDTLRTHRSLGLLLIGGATFVVGALAAVDALVRATSGARLAVVAAGVGAMLLSWAYGLRPAVAENPTTVEVRNPVRTAVIPWALVTEVDQTDVVRIHVGDLVVRCFALPRRMRPRRQPALSFAPRLPGVEREQPRPGDDDVARRLEDRAAVLGGVGEAAGSSPGGTDGAAGPPGGGADRGGADGVAGESVSSRGAGVDASRGVRVRVDPFAAAAVAGGVLLLALGAIGIIWA